MPKVKDVELSNSHVVVAVGLDEIPSTLSVDVEVPGSLIVEANLFHVIFNLNGILIVTCFNRGSRTIIIYPGLNEFIEKCLVQF